MGYLIMLKHVRLIAPSYKVPEEDVHFTKSYLEELGLKVTVPDNLLGKDLLCAHQDEVRLSHLKDALTDPTVDITWMLKGGYGLTRLLPGLLTLPKPEKEKLFIGFSDGTALHLFLNQRWNWPTVHGIGAIQASRKKVTDDSIAATLQILREGLASYKPPLLQPANAQAHALSSLSGSVIGGNLCLLEASLGTPWQVDTSGKILFLEEVDERGYRVDRSLIHLEQAGVFKDVKAIILGDFTQGTEPDGTSLIPPVLERFARTLPVPVFTLLGCGHGEKNIPLPFHVPLRFLG